ncbi:MAG TPA: PAS domain S-box protein, partial [Syntrophales bacterium]|nr:PAS domain S-box protein [Syntrophales bacterium]
MEKTIQELAELLNIVPGAGIMLDTDDKVIFWNKMAEEIYGWSIDDILGQDIKIIFDTTLFDYTEVKKTLMHEGKWSGELYNKRKDGQSLTSDGRFVLVTDDSGAPKFISGICIDISAIKTLERNIYQVQRLDSLGTLAGNIAHDINNILSTVLLSVEILRKNSPNESSSRILDTIATSTGRGSGIIKQLLTFSRSVRDEKCEIQPKYLVVEIGK